jgi:hypothetical protein
MLQASSSGRAGKPVMLRIHFFILNQCSAYVCGVRQGVEGRAAGARNCRKLRKVHKSQMSLYPDCGIRSDNRRYALRFTERHVDVQYQRTPVISGCARPGDRRTPAGKTPERNC